MIFFVKMMIFVIAQIFHISDIFPENQSIFVKLSARQFHEIFPTLKKSCIVKYFEQDLALQFVSNTIE